LLVITRKVGEKILIGKDVRITVVKILGKQVRLGIEAPPGIPIMRWENNLTRADSSG
jgi:carbon storage regulator